MDERPIRSERTTTGMRFTLSLTASRGQRQRKQARFGRFEVLCDEPQALGGDDSAPPPLAYFAAALGF